MDSQERFENMVGLVEAHQYEWAIWQAARRPPIGWKLVPHEPTKEMIEAGREQWHRIGTTTDAWQAMFCAAPTPERAQESAGVLTDDQIREIWMRETGTTEQDSPLAILDFARAVLAADKEPQP